MKLHRDIGVTQKTAWFMLQRIREVFGHDVDDSRMGGRFEVDQTFMGRRVRNMSNAKCRERKEAGLGSGTMDKTDVVGAKFCESDEVHA